MPDDASFTPEEAQQLRGLPAEVVLALGEFACMNKDASEGFEEAAKKIRDAALASMFEKVAQVRRDHLAELRPLLAACGAESEPSGSLKAAAHRWWLDLRAWLTDGDAYAVLAEVEFGEDAIKASYEELVPKVNGTPLHPLLETHAHRLRELVAAQAAQVRKTHDRMRELRDSSK